MENNLLKNATATVTEAIKADKDEDYEKAYGLYQRALEQFMVALKYEKNKATKDIVLTRVDGYMARAEQLKEALKSKKKSKKKAAAAASENGNGGGDAGDDGEKSKLRGALASAILTEKPNVKWDDVAGLEGAKEALKEAVILPAKFPQLFTGKRRPWKGILLYGPPGTGKSYLAKAVATEADSMFYSVSSSDLVSKWQGESERLVKNLFEMARENAPAIIFIDEIDSLCGSRSEGGNESARRIKTEFLVQMQGVGHKHDGILVLGATNTPWSLDPAMRRRFEKRIYIPLPEREARATMFKLHIGDTPTDLADSDYKQLGKASKGMSGSDISVAVREALMIPVRLCQTAKFFKIDQDGMYYPCREYPPCAHCPMQTSQTGSQKNQTCKKCGAIRCSLYDIEPEKLKEPMVVSEDFQEAMKNTTSSVSPSELLQFEDWTKEFGSEGS